jgi:hypothetical protein
VWVGGKAAAESAVQRVALLVEHGLAVERRDCSDPADLPGFRIRLIDVGQQVLEEPLLIFRQKLLRLRKNYLIWLAITPSARDGSSSRTFSQHP